MAWVISISSGSKPKEKKWEGGALRGHWENFDLLITAHNWLEKHKINLFHLLQFNLISRVILIRVIDHFETSKSKQQHLTSQTGGGYYIFSSLPSMLMGALSVIMSDRALHSRLFLLHPWHILCVNCTVEAEKQLVWSGQDFSSALPRGQVMYNFGLWSSSLPWRKWCHWAPGISYWLQVEVTDK